MELEIIVLVLLIFFVSTTIRSFFGFGDALLAMPLLTIVIGVKTAVPIVALVAIIIGLSILLKTWREINFKQLIPLIVASIAGIPIGLIYLKDTSEVIVKLVLAIILISFSLYRLLDRIYFIWKASDYLLSLVCFQVFLEEHTTQMDRQLYCMEQWGDGSRANFVRIYKGFFYQQICLLQPVMVLPGFGQKKQLFCFFIAYLL